MIPIADPLSIKNCTDIPSSVKSRLEIDNVCTNAVELSLRTDSSVSVFWVINLSLSSLNKWLLHVVFLNK